MADSFVTFRRVEFCETDAAGLVHFAALFCYMEQAEHALLRSLGTSVVAKIDDQWHLSWPRVQAHCDFLAPMRFEEQLKICVRVARLGKKSVTYQFDIYSESDTLVAKGRIVSVCCRVHAGGATIQSFPIPGELRKQLQALIMEES
ncbi:MAG: acyl-CoA thioesterase [Pirellulaceae bacterium]|nr:acyl-CoA thioesterase [Pirellulaceae bacterium]